MYSDGRKFGRKNTGPNQAFPQVFGGLLGSFMSLQVVDQLLHLALTFVEMNKYGNLQPADQ